MVPAIKEAKEQAYRQLEVKSITVGDFKGYGLYSAPKYDRGGWSDAGYRSAGAGSSFNGYVMKGKKIFEVYWYAGAGGAFDNSDQGWMMSMVKQLAAEACVRTPARRPSQPPSQIVVSHPSPQ